MHSITLSLVVGRLLHARALGRLQGYHILPTLSVLDTQPTVCDTNLSIIFLVDALFDIDALLLVGCFMLGHVGGLK